MSAYSASAPVNASTTAPSATNAMKRFCSMNANACSGLRADRITGALMMLTTPMMAIARNQTSMIGPNQRPMPAVPRFCTAYRTTSTAIVSGTTYCSNAGAATSRPSIAPSTEMAGVITLSP